MTNLGGSLLNEFPGSAGRHTCGIRNSALEMWNLANHLNLESKLTPVTRNPESNTVLDSLMRQL